MPVIDGIELHPWITADMRRFGDHLHELTRLIGLTHLSGGHIASLPFRIIEYGTHKLVRHAHRVIEFWKKTEA